MTTATGHIYYLSKKARESGNPYKALQEVPDIISNYITETVKSMDGKQLLVLVDGIKVNSGITTIDPKRIDYVEIKDVVNAKYMREGVQKILDIRLKPQRPCISFTSMACAMIFRTTGVQLGEKLRLATASFQSMPTSGLNTHTTRNQKTASGLKATAI